MRDISKVSASASNKSSPLLHDIDSSGGLVPRDAQKLFNLDANGLR